jgi:ATP-dependent RNA helicase RhlE
MPFTDFDLHPDLLKALAEMGFTEPTPVQKSVMGDAILGNDIRACAQTGSGKTLAFSLPLLNKLLRNPSPGRPLALIMLPTRELCSQVETVVRNTGKFTNIRCVAILGGSSFHKQVQQIKSGAQIVAATPGRLLDHLERHTFNLKNINTLILDEADRMLDMGFLPDIRRTVSEVSAGVKQSKFKKRRNPRKFFV